MSQVGALVRNKLNPELGPGRILDVDSRGQIKIQLLWHDTSYSIDRRNLGRYVLFGFSPVQFQDDSTGEVISGYVTKQIDSEVNSCWSYEVSVKEGDRWVTMSASETKITPLRPTSNHPLDHFRALTWQSPKKFLKRWRAMLLESRWYEDSGGIPALLGARVQPMAHQLYAARRVLWDRLPRFILADEVGLGKTIEAALVVQALKASKADLRVLIITPGSMARQWQTELYLRFGGQAYIHIDTSALAYKTDREKSEILKGNNLIITTTALETFPEVQQSLIASGWDLVIIDEAHQFPPGTPLYSLFHELARKSYGLLALSATPSKRELTSLAGLLSLVSPDIYPHNDHKFLNERIEIQRQVWDRLSFTSKLLGAAHHEGIQLDGDDLEYLASQWEGILQDDDIVSSLLIDLAAGRVEAANELVAYVQEFHRIDQRIIRTRRSTVESEHHHWSERLVNFLEYDPGVEESVLSNHFSELPYSDDLEYDALALRGLYYRAFASTPDHLLNFLEMRQSALLGELAEPIPLDALGLLTADPSPADEQVLRRRIVESTPSLPGELGWLRTAIGLTEMWGESGPTIARIRTLCSWLKQHLDESAENQVLLFAQDSAVVAEITNQIQGILPDVSVKSFHNGLSEEELGRVALQFQQNRNCRILVSDELGGEGRNFQNATGLVHFDLPWSVSRVEQRIGRLDRVGRGSSRPIISTVLCGPSPIERAIFSVHDEVFTVLRRSVGGLEYAIPKLQRTFNEAICRGVQQVNEAAVSLKADILEELSSVDEAYDLSLDASKQKLKETQKLAEWLKEQDNWEEEGKILSGRASNLGITVRRKGDSNWEFKWAKDELSRPLENLPPDGFITGTFNRRQALNDDRQQFFSPGHPFIDALTRDLHDSSDGRTTVMHLKLGQKCAGRIFALILFRCSLDEDLLKTVDSAPGLILRARRFSWPEIQAVIVEIHVDQVPTATLATEPELLGALRSPKISCRWEPIEPNALKKGIDDAKALWDSVESAIPVAIQHVRDLRKELVSEAAHELAADLEAEMSYLKWLGKQPGNEPQTLNADVKARQTLIQSVQNESVALESIAIVIGN